jgi:hypothetical protein
LRSAAALVENGPISTRTASVDYGALLATCAQESTGANPVVAALTRAALDWLGRADVKRLRAALLRIIGNLD